VSSLPEIGIEFATSFNSTDDEGNPIFLPYKRDPETLGRELALPGTPDLMHRIGGLEKADGSGNVSYSPENHERMTHLRAEKIAGIAQDIPEVEVRGDVEDAEIVLVGWGSTWGAISGAVDRVRAQDRKVAQIHIRHLNPFPPNLGEVLARYPKVLVPEMNLGQLSKLLRAEYLVDARSVTKVRGVPFTAGELERAIFDELAR
jgi:2-oxoglutarate ferredoxin oxidoreductase subunit alpha